MRVPRRQSARKVRVGSGTCPAGRGAPSGRRRRCSPPERPGSGRPGRRLPDPTPRTRCRGPATWGTRWARRRVHVALSLPPGRVGDWTRAVRSGRVRSHLHQLPRRCQRPGRLLVVGFLLAVIVDWHSRRSAPVDDLPTFSVKTRLQTAWSLPTHKMKILGAVVLVAQLRWLNGVAYRRARAPRADPSNNNLEATATRGHPCTAAKLTVVAGS